MIRSSGCSFGREADLLRWFLRLALLAVIAVVGLLAFGAVQLPPAYDPRTPLDISADPNILTRFKLSRLRNRPELCQVVLRTSDLRQTPVPDQSQGPGCVIENAVRVTQSGVAFNGSFVASCPLTAAWALYETHVLQPAARTHFGQPLARVIHFGTYACRNVDHRPFGRRSRHATADAIDVAGFVLRDGREISVARGWSGGNREARFLRAVRDGACRFFDAVLSPDYNAQHRDHFHLDLGGFHACR